MELGIWPLPHDVKVIHGVVRVVDLLKPSGHPWQTDF